MSSSHALTTLALTLALAGCSHDQLFRSDAELAQRNTAVAVDQPATLARAARVHTGPGTATPVVAELPAGTDVTVAASASRGFRRVRTADGKTGFVEASAVSVGQAATARDGATAPAGGAGSGAQR